MKRTSARTAILAYISPDGACAAALALAAYPEADLLIGSAYEIKNQLERLAQHDEPYGTIVVCGIGVHEENRELVLQQLKELKRRKSKVLWFSGKAFFGDIKQLFQDDCQIFCFPNYEKDTKAAAEIFSALPQEFRNFCVQVSSLDTWFENTPEARWLSLIVYHADQYFKYYDQEAYPSIIHRLAHSRELFADDERKIQSAREHAADPRLEGHSKAVKRCCKELGLIAEYDVPVLILGESGVGKDVAAKLIHQRSGRSGSGFCPVNCAVFSKSDLINSQLFGHIKGSFTGAHTDRKGLFEIAQGGTLFLDEIGDMPLESQALLLRVLEERKVRRVGDDAKTFDVDVRIIAATNKDIPAMIQRGEFREDLFYRINTAIIQIPPLRERPEDIDILVTTKLKSLKKKYNLKELSFSPKQMQYLKGGDWPGNTRQLMGVLESFVIFRGTRSIPELMNALDSKIITATQSPEGTQLTESVGRGKRSTRSLERGDWPAGNSTEVLPLDEMVRHYVQYALQQCGGVQAQAARKLGIGINTLKRKLR